LMRVGRRRRGSSMDFRCGKGTIRLDAIEKRLFLPRPVIVSQASQRVTCDDIRSGHLCHTDTNIQTKILKALHLHE
jgi:hypothetical protein